MATILPRLAATSADLDRCLNLEMVRGDAEERDFELEKDLPQLRALLEDRNDIGAVVIESVVAFVNPKDGMPNGRSAASCDRSRSWRSNAGSAAYGAVPWGHSMAWVKDKNDPGAGSCPSATTLPKAISGLSSNS